jgi:hypothetical protein
MDQPKLCELVGVQPGGTFFMSEMSFLNWGQEISFKAHYEAPESSEIIYFQIKLQNCRDLQWRVYAHSTLAEDRTPPPAALVNLRLGTNQHRKPFQMLTDSFGITILYGELHIQKTAIND